MNRICWSINHRRRTKEQERLPSVRRWMSVLVLAVLALIATACGTRAPGRLTLVNGSTRLERARVEAAAQPLLARGASLAVIAVDSGDERGEDFTRRLDEAGMVQNGQIAPDVIAIYVSFVPRYSELRAGTDWSRQLPNDTLRSIRLEQLNPALRAEDMSGGVAAALSAFDAHLAESAAWDERVWSGIFALGGVGVLFLLLQTAPGRGLRSALVHLWEISPPGRRQAQRRYVIHVEQARQRLDQQAATTHKAYQERKVLDTTHETRLADADQRRAALEQQTPADPDLLAQLHALNGDYRKLDDDIRARDRELSHWSWRVSNAARETEGLIGRLSASFEPSKRARKASKAPPTLSDAGRRQLDAFREQRRQLDALRATISAAVGPAPGLVEQLTRLNDDYASLQRAVATLWHAEDPKGYTAYLNAAQAQASAGTASYLSDTSSSSSAWSSSSSDYSNSSDYNNSSDWSSSSSDSSSPSSDGGSW